MKDTSLIDKKYIVFLSNRLKNFRDKGNGLFEFSHSCERQSSNKRRGYFYHKGNGYNFFCHNCNESSKFYNFLKSEDNWLYGQYHSELYLKEDKVYSKPVVEQQVEETKTIDYEGLIPSVDNDISLKFLKDRKIPEDKWQNIFYVEDFFSWATSIYSDFGKVETKEPRLIIPYVDNKDEIFGFTCRSFSNTKPKYIELKLKDNEMVYGLNHVNLSKKIFCVEGPIDSMFIDNCVAVGGASYNGEFVNKYKQNIVIVPDNDWKRNKHVCSQILKIANEGYSVSLFPEEFEFKDINEAVLSGFKADDIKDILNKNIKSGPELILDITFRRKC